MIELNRLLTLIDEELRANKDLFPAGEYPSGTCGDTSTIVAVCLAENGYPEFTYISGERGSLEDGNWTSHTWLETENFVIDLTARQFDDGPTELMIQKGSAFHTSFSNLSSRQITRDDLASSNLMLLYDRISQTIAPLLAPNIS